MVERQEKNYNCCYCGHKFIQAVRKTNLPNVHNPKKPYKHNVSDQVTCPNCENFLKTWG